MKNLELVRPLVSLDCETTGLLPGARVVEIALVRSDPDGATARLVHRVDPGVKIPAGATRIHGLGDEHVRGSPSFAQLWPMLVAFARDSDLCGFNIVGFDALVVLEECARHHLDPRDLLGDRAIVDAMQIFHLYYGGWPRKLAQAAAFYLGRGHRGAHGAEADADVVLEILDAQVAKHDLPRRLAELDQYPFVPEPLFPPRSTPREPATGPLVPGARTRIDTPRD